MYADLKGDGKTFEHPLEISNPPFYLYATYISRKEDLNVGERTILKWILER
jgi:hypothetical protein